MTKKTPIPKQAERIVVTSCPKCRRPSVLTHEDGRSYCLIHEGDGTRRALPLGALPKREDA